MALRIPLPWRVRGGPRAFHVSLDARRRFDLRRELVTLRGGLMLADRDAAFEVAHRVASAPDAPTPPLRGADLFAGALLEEVYHLVVAHYVQTVDPGALEALDEALRASLGSRAEEVLQAFVERYPSAEVAEGRQAPEVYLAARIEGVPGRLVALEELWACFLANVNPALAAARVLVDDRPLAERTAYDAFVAELRAFWRDRPGLPATAGSLFEQLLRPMKAAPDDLEAQLRFVQASWGPLLGDRFARLLGLLLAAVDALHETNLPRGGPPGPTLGFGVGRSPFGAADVERYSADSGWMPRVVMVAKSTHVWLGQLAREYGRAVDRLDQVPEEALSELARRGINAVWLIGLWERSKASRTIKRLRGQGDAEASAYALYDYVISADLGGREALDRLRERAARCGVRLAADMVPNHVGIDGRWVIEHPGWFVQLDHPPYPAYTFDGPDLCEDPRVSIAIEDHYYEGSDAAVVFRRRDTATGETRFIYHGNDGTSTPWNDTAQLDFLQREVREAVLQTMLFVARQFPIIRFDAAMTLAKEHVRRLWYPPPGGGGGVPSRGRYGAMSSDEFERAMPEEFWREVVDRLAAEVPDTLLLAEAFWMMEGYFVRSLGMHRVYNSAFMHMLKREDNREYRTLMKEGLAFDPQVLGRFVNFLSNPDEETAIAQFGDGGKYFAAATLLATMPGLPMFGHGQVEGYREKYGMEYRRAKLDELPDAALIARHEAEIFPLLSRRWQFAEASNFRLFDVHGANGVIEDVYAYANRVGAAVSLVLVNNRYRRAAGTLRESVPQRLAAGEPPRTTSLAEALGLSGAPRSFTVLNDLVAGRTYLRRSRELRERGLEVLLDGYQAQVFVDVHELVDVDGSLARLEQRSRGAGVASLTDALDDLRLEGVHDAFEELIRALARDDAGAGDLQRAALARFAAAGPVTVSRALQPPARGSLKRLERGFGAAVARAALATFALSFAAWPREAWRALRLERALARHLDRHGLDGRVAGAASVALTHLPLVRARAEPQRWLADVVQDAEAEAMLGRHEYAGASWFVLEGVAAVADVSIAALRLERPGSASAAHLEAWRRRLGVAIDASGYRVEQAVATASSAAPGALTDPSSAARGAREPTERDRPRRGRRAGPRRRR